MTTRNLLAEFVGTFTLVFIGAGTAAAGGSLTDIAIAHGFVIVALACALGPISGAHFNPAVTFGIVVAGAMQLREAASYWAAQFLGGAVAAGVLAWILGVASGIGMTRLAATIDPARGVAVEAILTFFLVTVILSAAVAGRGGGMAPVAIGATLTFCILMGGRLTGASLNPARSLGPALFTGEFGQLWIYFAGPLVGAAVAAGLYKLWQGGEDE